VLRGFSGAALPPRKRSSKGKPVRESSSETETRPASVAMLEAFGFQIGGPKPSTNLNPLKFQPKHKRHG
jgi:hypothetical protein